MTVSTHPYEHWSDRSDWQTAPYNTCSPNLLQLQDYYRRRWHAVSLGCHNDRPVRGGTTMSSHAWGAACDPRFPNRAVTVEAMGWTILYSAELGINTIHDYATQRMWKPLEGWRSADIGSVGGEWIHVETTRAMWADGRPVEDKLPGTTEEVPMALTDEDIQKIAKAVWDMKLARPDGSKQPAGSVLVDTLFTAAGVWGVVIPRSDGGEQTAGSMLNDTLFTAAQAVENTTPPPVA